MGPYDALRALGGNPNDDVSGSPVLHTLPDGRQILIAGQESGRITALDPDDNGAVLWVAQAGDVMGPGRGGGMGAAADGELYYRPLGLPDKAGGMAALRPATGERVWYATHPKPTGCSDPEVSSLRRTRSAAEARSSRTLSPHPRGAIAGIAVRCSRSHTPTSIPSTD